MNSRRQSEFVDENSFCKVFRNPGRRRTDVKRAPLLFTALHALLAIRCLPVAQVVHYHLLDSRDIRWARLLDEVLNAGVRINAKYMAFLRLRKHLFADGFVLLGEQWTPHQEGV